MSEEAITLWRPVGPVELRLIQEAEMNAFPPRLPEQPIFYPVTSEQYAVKIARDWNVPQSGSGFAGTSSTDTMCRTRAGKNIGSIGFPPMRWTHSTLPSLGRSKWCASIAECPQRVGSGR